MVIWKESGHVFIVRCRRIIIGKPPAVGRTPSAMLVVGSGAASISALKIWPPTKLSMLQGPRFHG